MFSCCILTCRGSGFWKAEKESLFSHWRNWLSPRLRCLWPFGRRNPQSCTEEVVEELVEGFSCSMSLDRGQGCWATNNDQVWSERKDESTLCLHEACRARALQAGVMEQLTECMLPAFPGSNICNVTTFVFDYSAFCPSHRVLDQLFARSCPPDIPWDALLPSWTSGGIFPRGERDHGPQDHLKLTIFSMVGTCLDHGQGFWEPLHFPCLMVKLAIVHVNFHGSDPEGHAYILRAQLEHLKPIETELEELAPELLPLPEPEQGPAPGLEPASVQVPPPAVELEPAPPLSAPTEHTPPLTSAPVPAPAREPAGPWAVVRSPAPSAQISAPDPALEPACPRAVTTENLLPEAKPGLLDFPPQLVAEQLTVMDAELFKKLVPSHCLGSVWSQRDNRDCEYLAPTVRDTVTHTTAVTNCVIATCLGDLSTTAQDRARVVELWIRVAEECRGLGNFSSLHTILSALRSPAIHRLKETWRQVSRESSRTFKKWCRREQRVSRELLVKEATSVLVTAQRAPRGAQERQQQQGVIPALGTFFTSLELLDAAMKDYLKGNVLNGRKWSEQFKLMEEIELLQEAASLYNLQPEEQFGAWFQAIEPLSADESYSLSCQLEPRHQWARRIHIFFKSKKHRSSSSSGQNTRPPTESPVAVADDRPENN